MKGTNQRTDYLVTIFRWEESPFTATYHHVVVSRAAWEPRVQDPSDGPCVHGSTHARPATSTTTTHNPAAGVSRRGPTSSFPFPLYQCRSQHPPSPSTTPTRQHSLGKGRWGSHRGQLQTKTQTHTHTHRYTHTYIHIHIHPRKHTHTHNTNGK